MKPARDLPTRDQLDADTPLRLDVAAAIGFPDGSMTARGLRREASRGRLAIERVAGKDYTTLADIKRMRDLCRVEAKAHGSTSASPGAMPMDASVTRPHGGLSTDDINKALAAAMLTVEELSGPSRPISAKSTSKGPRAGNVIRPKFRSRM